MFLKGFSIYIKALLPLATSSSESSSEIFFKAEINPSGFLVKETAVASAKYYILLETAICIKFEISGDKIKSIAPINIKIPCPEFESLSLLFLLKLER